MSGSGDAAEPAPAAADARLDAPLRAQLFEPLLTTAELGRPIYFHEQLESTNDEAHRLAEAGAEHGTVVFAERQTAGRGRRGRTWVSPAGKSLALSIILRPELMPLRAPELTLCAAVAVCELARESGAGNAAVKWPNDVESGGRKLSGMLAELRTDGERVSHVVLGLGLNVNLLAGDFPEELRAQATSLRIERGGEPIARPLVLARLLKLLETWLAVHEADGFADVRERLRELSSTLGKRVRAEFAQGSVTGVAVDLADDGALILRTDEGREVRVVAGDVEHLRPADPAAR